MAVRQHTCHHTATTTKFSFVTFELSYVIEDRTHVPEYVLFFCASSSISSWLDIRCWWPSAVALLSSVRVMAKAYAVIVEWILLALRSNDYHSVYSRILIVVNLIERTSPSPTFLWYNLGGSAWHGGTNRARCSAHLSWWWIRARLPCSSSICGEMAIYIYVHTKCTMKTKHSAEVLLGSFFIIACHLLRAHQHASGLITSLQNKGSNQRQCRHHRCSGRGRVCQ